MSGVYIKGMTAPRSCAECLDIGWNYVFECNLDDVESGEKRADCPLLTAPDHGRLVDADALVSNLLISRKEICNAPTILPGEEATNGE